MSKFKVTFTLKQHTPLIHFQADQAGATLRATELKPKFDRFLKEYVFGGNVPNKYKVKDDKDALNYKIKIIANNLEIEYIVKKIKKWNKRKKEEEIKTNNFPCFFATMGNEWKKSPKKFTFSNTVQVEIFSFHSDLVKIIKEQFPIFIFKTNFGTRQSKGFGSFSVVKIDDNPYENTYDNHLSFEIDIKKINKKFFTTNKYIGEPSKNYLMYIKLFEVIDLFYKTLRSGINLNGQFYFKSLLYMYAKSRNIVWDKKYFKQQFLGEKNADIQEQRKRHDNPEILDFSDIKDDNYFLVRDLLGLATIQEWMSYKKRIRHPKDGDELNNQPITKNAIERMKSPITIKPIQITNQKFRIYLIFDQINDAIFDEQITILQTHTIGKGEDKKEIIDKKLDNLQFWRDFSLKNYFDFIAEKIDIENHIEQEYHKHPYFTVLNDIYSQLKGAK